MVKSKNGAGGGKDLAQAKRGEGLRKTIAFRITPADYDAYRAKFEASGLSQSAFFREAVLTNRTQVVARPKTSADKRQLLYLFNKASNNINQLAHRANADHLAGKIGDATYRQILAELQTLAAFLKGSINGID